MWSLSGLLERDGVDPGDGSCAWCRSAGIVDRETLPRLFHSQIVQAHTVGMELAAWLSCSTGEVLARFDELALAGDGSFDQTYVRMDLLARRPA